MDRPNGDADGLDRRSVLRRSAALAATPALIGVGAAQSGNGTGNETGGSPTGSGDEDEDATTTTAAVPAGTPTIGHPSYAGLFLHVGNVQRQADARGLGSCPFFGSGDEPAEYEATFIDRSQRDNPEDEIRLFVSADNGNVDQGKLFIVNQQQQCGDSFVQLQLESVGAEYDVNTAGEDESENGGDGTTQTDTPGFGFGAGVAGLLAAAGGYVLRRDD